MTLNICKSILPINSPSSASSLSFRMSRSQHFSKGLTGTWIWLGWVFLHDEFVSEIFWNTLGFPWIFHQPRFFWNKGISRSKRTIWSEVVWGRYNLTSNIPTETTSSITRQLVDDFFTLGVTRILGGSSQLVSRFGSPSFRSHLGDLEGVPQPQVLATYKHHGC